MLDAALKAQLTTHLQRLQRPIELIASLDGGEKSAELRRLLADIASCSPRVSVVERDEAERTPSFAIAAAGEAPRVRFAGLPLGHEFSSLVLALLQVGGHPPRISPEQAARIRALEGEFSFEVYMSLSCHNCPDVVQALNVMSALNPRIRNVTVDGALFQDELAARQVMAVPSVFVNGKPFGQGRMDLDEILSKVDSASAQREAARQAAQLSEREPYDVLVIGGGPAGAAAAIYAARKGIRTGVVADRFGGQTLDTLGIENFVSVPHTEGPTFAAALENHVRDYEVDVMNHQRVQRLSAGDLLRVSLASGATLKSRTVIVATGARWREVGVPGEREYRGKGVAYCPHCDGPLFKGKRVAVIGGGNSGVEAAIDLAGTVQQLTLLEFGERLRADAVLLAKLSSLPNVRVVTNAQTTEITGADGRVNGLRYTDRADGVTHELALEGVFVQIGLVPNTDWLAGTLELSRHGEIVVDARGQTSLPGVFAAGDVTTVPYKQIVIAVGEGAKAALGAFDHLVRVPAASLAPAQAVV